LRFSLQAASPETFGYTLVSSRTRAYSAQCTIEHNRLKCCICSCLIRSSLDQIRTPLFVISVLYTTVTQEITLQPDVQVCNRSPQRNHFQATNVSSFCSTNILQLDTHVFNTSPQRNHFQNTNGFSFCSTNYFGSNC
jgi:hypothetical protein